MRNRPHCPPAFVTPVWASAPRQPFIPAASISVSPSPLLKFSSRRLPRFRLYMQSQDKESDDATTTTRTRPHSHHYGGVSPKQTQAYAPPPPSQTEESPQIPQTDRRLLVAGGGLLTLFTVGVVAAATGAFNSDTLVSLAAWFETLGPAAIFLYAGIYFFLELVAVPALPLTLGSGYLFGLVKGTAAVSVASTLAAAASFLIARYGLRDAITNLARRYPRFRAMDRAIGKQGFKFVFLLRLSPLLPFAISNYLYGLTSVNLPEYVLGSWLGMLPGTIAYVSAGAAVSALTDLGAGKSEVNPIVVVIGVAATVGALTLVGKLAAESVGSVDDEEVAQSN